MPADVESVSEVERIEVALVLEAIYARYGYDLRGYAEEPMRRRVRSVLARSRVGHFGELQHRLLHDADFFGEVLDALTVQVSTMFRDPDFYRAVRERVCPILRTYPKIKIWHAGCSSGEEVYASAILLLEEGLYDRTQIYATDISDVALERARAGAYPASRVAQFAADYQAAGGRRPFEAYFSIRGEHAVIDPELGRNIVLFRHNLVTDQALGEMHAIFCRNVLIYFGSGLRRSVLDTLMDGLATHGFLCLGSSEALPDSHAERFASFDPRQRIFRYRG